MQQAITIGWQGLRDLRATASQLLLAGLIYKVLALAVLSPLVGALVTLFVRTSGGEVLADMDILFFFLSPLGLVAAVIVGAVSIATIALDEAGLMSICFGHTRQRPVGFWVAVRFALRRLPGLLEIAGRIVARCLVTAAPFLAVSGVIYLLLVSQHDINFYLSEQPPSFLVAVGIVGTLVAAGALLILRRALGWIIALPLFLFERVSPSEALRQSEERVQARRMTVAMVMGAWLALSALANGVPLAVLALFGRLALPYVAGSMTGVVLLVSVLIGLWAVLNALSALFFAAYFAALAVRLYERLTEVQVELPDGLAADRMLWQPTRRALWIGMTAAVLVAAGMTALLVDDVRTDDDVKVIAHRGASAEAPENTLAAVALALEQGADSIEIDVQESADGEVMVVHDADLMRIGGQPLPIWSTSAEELRAVDVGRWFGAEYTGQRLPTLAEVLELCRDRAEVLIELKFYGREVRLEERVIEEVERLGMTDQIVAMSLKYGSVTKLKQLRPDWRVGLLTARAVGDLTTTSADFLAVNHAIASPAFINRAHAAGKEVYVWTINDALNMSRMITRGVDGLITDYPARTFEVVAARQEMSSVERLLLAAAFYVGLEPREPDASVDTEG